METLMENNLALAEANRQFCESMLPHPSVNREALGYFGQGCRWSRRRQPQLSLPAMRDSSATSSSPSHSKRSQARTGGKGAAALEGALNDRPKALLSDGQNQAAAQAVPSLVKTTRAFLGSVAPEQWSKLNKVLESADADMLEAAGQAETDAGAATAIRSLQQQLLADFGRLPKIQEALSPEQVVELLRLAAEASRVGSR